jgi:ABC-type transport system involved in multi-copper enzyme maturation permease subunit
MIKRWKMLPWSLWGRQAAAVVRLELQKNLFSRRAIWVYMMAAGAPLVALLHWVTARPGHCSLPGDAMAFAGMFEFYYLRLALFLGCVGIFSNLTRGEMLERTLHYYLLSPVRREVLILAKYLAGLVTATGLFALSVALTFLAIGAHFGVAWQDFVFHGAGGRQLGAYLLVTVLACVGYGAVFTVAGLVVRNPMIPAAVVWIWEAGNAFLPSLLKKLSVIFYLKSLSPVQAPVNGPLALLATATDPTPAYLAIPGLLIVAAGLLALAARRARSLEISYAE